MPVLLFYCFTYHFCTMPAHSLHRTFYTTPACRVTVPLHYSFFRSSYTHGFVLHTPVCCTPVLHSTNSFFFFVHHRNTCTPGFCAIFCQCLLTTVHRTDSAYYTTYLRSPTATLPVSVHHIPPAHCWMPFGSYALLFHSCLPPPHCRFCFPCYLCTYHHHTLHTTATATIPPNHYYLPPPRFFHLPLHVSVHFLLGPPPPWCHWWVSPCRPPAYTPPTCNSSFSLFCCTFCTHTYHSASTGFLLLLPGCHTTLHAVRLHWDLQWFYLPGDAWVTCLPALPSLPATCLQPTYKFIHRSHTRSPLHHSTCLCIFDLHTFTTTCRGAFCFLLLHLHHSTHSFWFVQELWARDIIIQLCLCCISNKQQKQY